MSRELLDLVAGLDREHELAPPAAMLSDARGHHDREVARLLLARDPAVIPALLARADETREVLRAAPPHLPVEGGYGRMFGRVTVGDKARFALTRLLGEALAADAIAGGPGWWRANGNRLRWSARLGRFTLGR